MSSKISVVAPKTTVYLLDPKIVTSDPRYVPRVKIPRYLYPLIGKWRQRRGVNELRLPRSRAAFSALFVAHLNPFQNAATQFIGLRRRALLYVGRGKHREWLP